MAIQLKMRYRYTSAGSWNYPPTTLRGLSATADSLGRNTYELPSTYGKTMPALSIPIVRVSGNEVVPLVGSVKLEKDGGFGLELNPKFILQRVGNADDEGIYLFLKKFDAAPLKQIGYFDGYAERFINDGSTMVMDVVSKQSMDVGDKNNGNRVGVTLHLESKNYFESTDSNG